MIGFQDRQFATVWEVQEDNGNVALVRFTTSRKDKRDGKYKNTSWTYTRWLGDAYKKIDDLVEALASSDKNMVRVVIKGGISREEYETKEGERAWPKQPQLMVFNWEFAESYNDGSASGMDTPPQVEGDDDDLPF